MQPLTRRLRLSPEASWAPAWRYCWHPNPDRIRVVISGALAGPPGESQLRLDPELQNSSEDSPFDIGRQNRKERHLGER